MQRIWFPGHVQYEKGLSFLLDFHGSCQESCKRLNKLDYEPTLELQTVRGKK